MNKQWLNNFTDVPLALIAFSIFAFTFFAVLVWTFRKNSKSYYQKISYLPLKEDEGL